MGKTSILFMASLCAAAGLTLAAGCGSSSSKGAAPVITGDDSSTDDGGPLSCSPIGASCPAGQGLTCCVDITSFSGTCVPPSQCTSNIQYECMNGSGCAAKQACCGGLAGDAGALLAAIADAGDASFSVDAASLSSGAGAGLLGDIGNLMVNSTCQAACMGAQYQLCASNSECTAPQICGAPTAAAGAGALTGAAGGLISIMVCELPVADSGTTDSGSTTTPEAGTTSDAGTTTPEAGGSTDSGASDAPTGG